jgi:hypothetical protein
MDSLTALSYFQLKYCERCGGLWLRPHGLSLPYCPACEHFLAALPRRNRRYPRTAMRRTPVSVLLSALALLTLGGVHSFSGWCA